MDFGPLAGSTSRGSSLWRRPLAASQVGLGSRSPKPGASGHRSVMLVVYSPLCGQTGPMKLGPLRHTVLLMLGLLVAMGMSLSVVQASAMATDMTMSGENMSGMDGCGSCKDLPDDAKMTCGAPCVAPMNATVPQFDVLLVETQMDRPIPEAMKPSSWTLSPNPHPPRLRALI